MKKDLVLAMLGMILSVMAILIAIAELVFSILFNLTVSIAISLICCFSMIFIANLFNYLKIKQNKE